MGQGAAKLQAPRMWQHPGRRDPEPALTQVTGQVKVIAEKKKHLSSESDVIFHKQVSLEIAR